MKGHFIRAIVAARHAIRQSFVTITYKITIAYYDHIMRMRVW